MKIALVGFGNMGQEIARIVDANKKDNIVSISYDKSNKALDLAGIKTADVVIDFTSPEIVLKNIEQIAALKKNIVIGTTGWYEGLGQVKQMVKKNNIGLVYGQNFSIGANIFFEIIRYSSALVNTFQNYDVYGLEIHHTGKKDSPSGTGKKLSEIILQNFPSKRSLQFNKLDGQIRKEELHFVSVRGGRNPGKHEIIFDSEADEIQLVHQAHNRNGFAEGALRAAAFIQNKKGFYSFEEVFKKII